MNIIKKTKHFFMLVVACVIAVFSHNTASNKGPTADDNNYEIVLHIATRELHICNLSLDDVRKYLKEYQHYIRSTSSYTGCVDQGDEGVTYFSWHHVYSIDIKRADENNK